MKRGIVNGNADGEFMPNDKLTRGQMAAILVKGIRVEGRSEKTFKDVDPAYWASDLIKTLFANEITTGYPNNTYNKADIFHYKERISVCSFYVY